MTIGRWRLAGRGAVVGLAELLLAASGWPARAAGVDCGRAATPAAQAICKEPELARLDAQLARRYGEMARTAGRGLAALQAAQRAWIRAQTACQADIDCLTRRYQERLAELHPPLDGTDERALQALRAEIERQGRASPEFALERALQALRIGHGITEFSNAPAEGEPASSDRQPPTKRPTGVSESEWRAAEPLLQSDEAEHGMVSYLLLDADGDGQRELVIDAYVGGTGLFNHISVEPLFGPVAAAGPWSEPLYSLNGRGSHQYAEWVRLAGRVYVAWVDGQFGRDRVHLLRPLHAGAPAWSLVVHYGYTLRVTGLAEEGGGAAAAAITPQVQTTLDNALKRYADGELRGPPSPDQPLCPPRQGAEDDSSFGPGHYSFEVVGEQAVWLQGQCHFAQLIDWFGRYTEQGLQAQLWVRRPGGEQHTAYEVSGPRRLLRIVAEPAALPGP